MVSLVYSHAVVLAVESNSEEKQHSKEKEN